MPRTEETKKKLSVSNSGENHPQFGVPRTEKTKKKLSVANSGENHPLFGKFGALHHSSKAIIAMKPDDTELYFGSGREAAEVLGINHGSLCGKYLKTSHVLKRGKFKGWQFRYQNSEEL